MTITIHPMQPEDIHAMHTLHHAAVRKTCASAYSTEDIKAWLHNQRPSSFLHSQKVERESFLVAVKAGKVVGFCGWRDDKILDLYVDPACQRQGIARQLVTAAEAETGKPFTQVESTLNGVEFYKRLGFTAIRQHDRAGMPPGVHIQEVTMQRLPTK